ncbi:hypothetical protein BLNAU_1366 [Blattamonas nauphoetae]|uniref:Glycosyl hydrolase family 31 C-terminal domain-containing protein n=1 Tax=Blattamonas nauphoetae TaxID=2049346 RepID=A0ABQ9YJ59_9EUKA|nr:hypothetical protein BLNAU_1366 [Blattamonas nauphoetae]
MNDIFPTDSNTYGTDKQAMLGNILLCTPVLTEGATSVAGYFPLERWYSFNTDVEDAAVSMKGKQVTVSAPISTCPAHFKGGSIVTRQRTRALNIQKMKDSPIFVTAFMSKDNTAEGFLFVDDGDYIRSLCRSMSSTESVAQSNALMRVLNEMLAVCPAYRPTFGFVCSLPAVWTTAKFLVFFDDEELIQRAVSFTLSLIMDWTAMKGDARLNRHALFRSLLKESMLDMCEQRLKNCKDTWDGSDIAEGSLETFHFLGMNVGELE